MIGCDAQEEGRAAVPCTFCAPTYLAIFWDEHVF
jgi:hypothetical protein